MIIIHGAGQRLARMCRKLLTVKQARKRVRPALQHWKTNSQADWNTDLFLAYPHPSLVQHAPPQYQALHDFYIGNKYDQWQECRKFWRCPEIEGPPYVVRPLRHERGEGFEISQTLPPDSRKTTHYWRSLFHRSCEYRVFFAHGHKVLTLLKRVPGGTDQEIPWNVGISSFVTVHNHECDRLRHSKFYEKAEAFLAAFPFKFLCVDVLYSKHRHRVVEVNFSPNISIVDNLNLLATKMVEPHLSHHDRRNSD